MFIVTLTSTHAACGYKGRARRTMPLAYRDAVKRAGKPFLAYRDAVYPHSDLGADAAWRAAFDGAARGIRRTKYTAVTREHSGLHVRIERAS